MSWKEESAEFTVQEKRENWKKLQRKKDGARPGQHFCRVCERYIDKGPGGQAWANHILQHKRLYCEKKNQSKKVASRVEFEAVVELLNPKFAKKNTEKPPQKVKPTEDQGSLEGF